MGLCEGVPLKVAVPVRVTLWEGVSEPDWVLVRVLVGEGEGVAVGDSEALGEGVGEGGTHAERGPGDIALTFEKIESMTSSLP